MKSTSRFEAAVQKLYTAFHSGTLIPECSKQCAVGNILDNTDAWKHLSDEHGTTNLNYIGKVHEMMGKKFNGYTPLELLRIEQAFLRGCGYELPLHYKKITPKTPTDDTVLFDGLCEAINVLCKLEGLKNSFDILDTFINRKTPHNLLLKV